MRRLGTDLSLDDAKELLQKFDTDDSGEVDPREFYQCLLIAAQKREEEDQIPQRVRQAFAEMDDDGSGHVTIEEFQNYMLSVGCTISLRDATELVNEHDEDQSGHLTLPEFHECVKLVVSGEWQPSASSSSREVLEMDEERRREEEEKEKVGAWPNGVSTRRR